MFRRHHIHFAWHVTVRTYRVLTWIVLIGGLVIAVALLALRYYVLPDIDRYRSWIEGGVMRATGQQVSIAKASGDWHGYRPSLRLEGVVIYDRERRPALELGQVEAVLAWRSLLLAQVRFHTLVIDRPDLMVRRDAAGVVTVAGFPINTGGPGSGFTDWLLAQEEVQVDAARLTWIDETRGAEPLTLTDVDFHLVSLLRHHRFGLRFVPPPEVGSAIDVRGDLRRRPGSGMAGWRGKLYARSAYLNLASGKAWVDLPVDVDSGAADAEVWADVADGQVTELTADLRIASLAGHLGEGLPQLQVPGLQGRFRFARTQGGQELSGRRVSLVLGSGAALGPSDVVFRHMAGERLQIQADRLDIGPIVALADALPLEAGLRARLAEFAPRGRLEDVRLAWTRGATRPEQFDLEGRFIGLGIAGTGAIPGVSGLSGRIQSDANGGKLELDTRTVVVDWPVQLTEPIALDWIKSLATWTYAQGHPQVQLQRLAFANGDAAGSATGTYRGLPAGPGAVDLKASLSRADAHAIRKYLPVVLGPATRRWLSTAFEAGTVRDAKLALQGNLADFPFDEPGKTGLFEMTASVEGLTLRFAPDWPTVDQVAGNLRIRGRRLETSAVGSIRGVAIDPTTAVIPELSPRAPVLEIKGGARGPTQDFLTFIEGSPVAGMIGGFTRGLRSSGQGELALDLRIPLDHDHVPTIAGTYRFKDNGLEESEVMPALSNLNATLEFTQAGAKVVNATANVFELPARFSVSTEPGGVVNATASGRANPARLQKLLDSPWLASFDGETEWRARVGVRNRVTDIVVESDLVGLRSRLPSPLAKPAGEPLPLRVQRRSRGAEQVLQVTAGQRLAAVLALDTSAKATRVKRGTVSFGAPAKLGDGPGVVVSGSFDRIDVDAWLDLQQAAAAKGGGDGGSADLLSAIDLKAKEVELFGRVLHDVAIRVNRRNDIWDGQIDSREVAGDVDWIPSGRGRLVGRLARLRVPDTGTASEGGGAEPIAGRDLPAVDVTADDFHFGGIELGALVLKATPNGPAWQVEKLDLANPDFKFSAQGAWQSVRGTARTQLGVRLDITDIGRFLHRVKAPEGIAGGSASVEGPLEWEGLPYRLDYPSLNGKLKFDASKGRFVKLEPGIGRLLGVFSLQSLPRRVSLDFRDIFSEGFAFERITGDFDLQRGVIHTDDLRMVGSSAKVNMKGDVNLVNETQTLDVRVVPSISDSVALGTALVNPAVGLATFLVGKALKDPLDQFIAFEYKISGAWTDPVVAKVQRQNPSAPIGRR